MSNSESKLSEIEGLHDSIYDEDGLKQEIDEVLFKHFWYKQWY